MLKVLGLSVPLLRQSSVHGLARKQLGIEAQRTQPFSATPRSLPVLLPMGSALLANDRFQKFGPGNAEVQDTQPSPLKVVRPTRKLMSYNAENFNRLGVNNPQKLEGKVQALAQAINQEAPDVIALQEVGDRKLLSDFNQRYLKGEYPNIVSHRVPRTGAMQVALMSRKGVDIADSKSHWGEMCPDNQCSGKRDFLEATFKTGTGYQFTVFNAHLKSMRGDEAKTAPVRMQDAKAAAAVLKRFLLSKPQAHILVAGDFNALYHTPLGKPVIDTIQYLDSVPEARGSEPDFSEVFLKAGKDDPTESSKGRFPDAKLDYIFTSRALTPNVQKSYVAGRFDQAPWQAASDHLPVITVFEEGEPPKTQALPTSERKQGIKQKLELIA